ncbi:uncharacterized protein [Eurosta solidaginis]|uniref:uncharacterized protein n=1 Tax=Eurosta solidaginis TaxID=178769 RepID=UPI003530AAC5
MIFENSYASNHLNEVHSGKETNGQKGSDSDETDNQCNLRDEDTSNAELFVRLTDMVRKHYCGYLEKQLLENVQVWRANKKLDECSQTDEVTDGVALKECCRLLEDKALKACMHARRYQRTMLKIIAEVRRNTQEFRLEEDLRKLLITDKTQETTFKSSYSQKSTQTDESSFCIANKPRRRKRSTTDNTSEMNQQSPCSLTLQQKIEMFQQRLNQETAAIVAATHKRQHYAKARRQNSTNNHSNANPPARSRYKHSTDIKLAGQVALFEKCDSIVMPPPANTKTSSDTYKQKKMKKIKNIRALSVVNESTHCTALPAPPRAANNAIELLSSAESYILEQDDEIAKELDQLFSEEKSDLEELLGLNTDTQIDDPQIRNVLEEIQKAPLSHELKPTTTTADISRFDTIICSPQKQLHHPTSPVIQNNETNMLISPTLDLHDDVYSQTHSSLAAAAPVNFSEKPSADLKHSLWPCELYMQRRRLTASLNRLIEEDFRWHDIIKWKFYTLFGEDSDDEFATCSPSIELDEILINSCIRRISPWIVKHLMKPMRDGLIANRFLFKKLAKRLAHAIIMENQYPDERLIKCAVEEYFCLHQAVLSLEDMTEMPNLKSIDDT